MPDEENVVQDFDRYFQQYQTEKGYRNFSTALSSQDKILSDQLVCSGISFALIEFKGISSDIVHENKKKLREFLCKKLRYDDFFLKLHQQCHYISWRDCPNILVDIYANQVCRDGVFRSSDCHVENVTVDGREPLTCQQYVENLATPGCGTGLTAKIFQNYINELYQIADTDPATLRLIASDPAQEIFEAIKFNSIAELYVWYKDVYNAHIAPKRTPKRGGYEPKGP